MAEAASVLATKDKPGRVLGDGELRLVEVLRVRLTEVRDLPARGASDRCVSCLVRLDGRDVFQSASVPKSLNSFFGDEFSHEVRGNFGQLHFILCEQYHGRVPRPFARVSLRKNDVIKYSGQDMWYPLKPFSRHSDVSGKICLEIGYQECLNENSSISQSIRIRVLDHNDLNVPTGTRPVELYLLVTLHANGHRLETKKLRVPTRKAQKGTSAASTDSNTTLSSSTDDAPSLTLDLDGLGADSETLERSQLRLSVWHDLLGGFNSYFHGELRIQLDERTLKPRADRQGPQWYYLKPRLSVEESRPGSESTGSSRSAASGSSAQQLGALRLRLSYTADHILPMARYNELWTNLTDSINHQPFFATPAGILEWLPAVDLETVARPLMKIFVEADLIRPLLRILYTQELSRCQDVNTLFRSSSLSGKVLYELMKFVGHQYLIISLKPVIDKIYNEKKSCEVDPAKLTPGQSLEHNTQNLILYAETAFSRVVDSNHRCPQALRDTFGDLREVVNSRFPGRVDVQRLALSSFLIMRFFAAAILNPKLFGLKRENADTTVSRTLALVSKILQRLSNCVVSAQPLTVKELWMADIFERFTDEKHRLAMVKFLDRISCVGGENSISGDSVSVLREGWIMERFAREKRCLKLNWMLQKRRYVVLTEAELYWTKAKTEQPKGRLILSEVNLIEPVDESTFGGKHIFRIASATNSIYLQASNGVEMTDWLAAIQKQCRRQLMIVRQTTQLSQLYDVEIDRELEAIHMSFLEHAEALKHWNNALDGLCAIPEGEAILPTVLSDPITDEDVPETSTAQSSIREQFSKSLQSVLLGTMVLEKAHRDAVFRYMKQMRYGSIDNPIGDDNYLLLKSRMKDLTPDGGGV